MRMSRRLKPPPTFTKHLMSKTTDIRGDGDNPSLRFEKAPTDGKQPYRIANVLDYVLQCNRIESSIRERCRF
jgi:hypothetical protein